ncbi:hypothetical protein DV096_02675 [Bradymonadaceae bacterium TMQ3]|uniref:TonB C-terminal domain-containing protein n=1 Tax=Lujinxingia sediminis TaxID=2480984 RepID=A0ABY0CX45_9DELT|nr:TonB C-terminal domain-containing protein [Lujinxingia sediminis]RDV39494.1 hypothetical protein DV096_02675 [Bradymonadaceae bacterium TMQ3]RVU48461.1 hypothetical protein EA187_03225 [Lujinxingia sediminis]TXC77763.1 TonB C-terminal domain-containing protein [Bradymonadales bacterium TMQ1]
MTSTPIKPASPQQGGGAFEIGAGIALTLALHGIIALSVWWASTLAPEEPEQLELVFDRVELLALGEERPEAALPRMANPEPPPPAPDEAVVVPDPEPQPDENQVNLQAQRHEEEQERQRQRDEEERRREQEERERRRKAALSALSNPDRPYNDDAPEGSPDGVAGGTVSDAAMANMMGTYQARLLQEILRAWTVPTTLGDAELAQLAGSVRVFVRLSEGGKIVSHTFRARSGNEQFDASIDRAIRQFHVQFGGRTLPLPDNEDVRREVLREGLLLTRWDSTAR